MGVTILPINSEMQYESKYGGVLASLSEVHEDEATIILSENFRSLFNLLKLEENLSDTFLQALVFTVGNPFVFLAFLPSDHPGQTARQTSSRNRIEAYVSKLVRSLTSAIHTFSEESIAIATVIVDSDDLSSLREKIDDAKNRLPPSRRGMTEAVYRHLVDAVTASLGLAACVAGSASGHPEELGLVNDLRCSKGRMRRLFSALGYVILHLEDAQSPRISSSLTSYEIGRTLDPTKPALVVCSDRNRKSLKEVLRRFKWDAVTRPTAETSQTYGTVLVVDLDEKEGNRIADLFKAATTVLWIYTKDKVSPSSQSAPSRPDPIGVSRQRLKSGPSETPAEAKEKGQPSRGKRRSRRIRNRSAKISKACEPQTIASNETLNAGNFAKASERSSSVSPQGRKTSTLRQDHPTKSAFMGQRLRSPLVVCHSQSANTELTYMRQRSASVESIEEDDRE